MQTSDVLSAGILLILIIFDIFIIDTLFKIRQLIIQQILEPKHQPVKAPQIKSNKLRYNPANLFNPYAYSNEDELDPIIPGAYKQEKRKKDDDVE